MLHLDEDSVKDLWIPRACLSFILAAFSAWAPPRLSITRAEPELRGLYKKPMTARSRSWNRSKVDQWSPFSVILSHWCPSLPGKRTLYCWTIPLVRARAILELSVCGKLAFQREEEKFNAVTFHTFLSYLPRISSQNGRRIIAIQTTSNTTMSSSIQIGEVTKGYNSCFASLQLLIQTHPCEDNGTVMEINSRTLVA